MRNHIHGEQLAFAPPNAEPGAPSTEPLIVPVRLSAMPNQPLFLLLDSGANAPFLWSADGSVRKRKVASQVNTPAGQGAAPAFTVLPPQEMQIGKLLIHEISLATPAMDGQGAARIGVDGLLPTAQFRRVYIDYNHRFVVLDSW